MTLADWLEENKIADADFAERIGVTRQALHRYRNGIRVPERKIMSRIITETKGKVSANDFYSEVAQ